MQITHGGKALFGTLCDISASGFAMTGKFELPQSATVQATLQLGATEHEKLGLVSLLAYLLHSTPVEDGFRHGFEYAFVAEHEYDKLMKAVAVIEAEAGELQETA